jgi:CubicO group peptidase (beta-lactamase class C family)
LSITRRQLALSAMGSGLLAGCGSLPSVGAAAAGTGSMGAERLARIAPALAGEVERGIFPGAVSLVAHRGQVVHHEAVGFLDAAKTKPMPRDAIFRQASMTKPITSVATMMLVEQGRLKINDPIINWLPELKNLKVETPAGDVPLARPITVQDLLMHTAGFVYGPASPSDRIKKMYAELQIEASTVDVPGDVMLERLGTIPLQHQPGTTWFCSSGRWACPIQLGGCRTRSARAWPRRWTATR